MKVALSNGAYGDFSGGPWLGHAVALYRLRHPRAYTHSVAQVNMKTSVGRHRETIYSIIFAERNAKDEVYLHPPVGVTVTETA